MVGTIGGGCTEAEVWNAAREVMETEKPKMLNFNLGQDAAYDQGLICGGQLNVYVEPVLPIPSCFIFGAGHISKSLSKIATLAGFRTVDRRQSRKLRQSRAFSRSRRIFAEEYEEVFPKLAGERLELLHHRHARPQGRHARAALGSDCSRPATSA